MSKPNKEGDPSKKGGHKPRNEDIVFVDGEPHLVKDSRYRTEDGEEGFLFESSPLKIDNSEDIPYEN